METLPVKPERLAQLEDLARRRGKSTADALDDALADYLEWELQDYHEAIEGVRRGLDDVKAGRTVPADEFLDEFARKRCHGRRRPITR
jgi:predicted transcriptional regulator